MRALVLVMAALTASLALGQELRSIDDTMAGISDDLHATAYMTSRCSGLFDGAIAYGGQNMEEEMVQSFREASALMTMGTTVIRVLQAEKRGLPAKGVSQEMQNSVAETRRFSNIYSERFQSNYDTTGTMMENDPLTTADLDVCGKAAPEVRSLIDRVLGQASE